MLLPSFVSRAPYVTLFALCALGTIWVFGPILFQPNAYLLGGVGDALKTYYSVEYFARYGSGHLHTGMNYPYGNHPLFLDMHPLFAYLIRWVSRYVVDISGYTVGLLNLSVMLSFFPCAFFLYNILRNHLLPVDHALVFAWVITFLSPQIYRFSGHLALSYVFFVPMMWYFLQQVFAGLRRRKWLIAYASSQLLFALIHPYYSLIGAAFFFAYLLVFWLQNRKAAATHFSYLATASLLILLPFPLLKLWEWALIDRGSAFVEAPYGFFAYIAGFESIFLPLIEPLKGLWNSVIRLRRMETEGYAYVGFAGLLLLAATLYRAIRYGIRRQWVRIWKPVLPMDLRTAVWAGTLLLIPAMAYPFQWFPDLADWLGPVRQFRSLGRLAWPFYYVYMAYCAFLLHLAFRRLRQSHRAWIGRGVLALFIASWGISSWVLVHSQQQFYFRQHVSTVPELYADYRSALSSQGYDVEDFQAILALPFYHVGTEKLALPQWQSNRASFGVSIDTGLPIINTKAARMPLDQGLEAIQLVASPYIHKALPGKLPYPKPLLISYCGSPLTEAEQALIDQARPITEVAGVHLLALDLQAFSSGPADAAVQLFETQQDSLSFTAPFIYTNAATQAVVFEGYGDGPGDLGMGKVNLMQPSGRHILFEGTLATQGDNEWMEASVWVRCEVTSSYLPPIDVAVFEGSQQVAFERTQAKESRDYDRGWVRVTTLFQIPTSSNRVVISAKGKHLSFDHLLIRPASVDVFLASPAHAPLVFNNYFLPIRNGTSATPRR